jgi:hypothetical protein
MWVDLKRVSVSSVKEAKVRPARAGREGGAGLGLLIRGFAAGR